MKIDIALKWLLLILLPLQSGILHSQGTNNVTEQFTHKLTKILYDQLAIEYEYNDEGLIIQELSYDSNRSEITKYTYNDSDNISVVEIINCHYSNPCETTIIEYEYDFSGNINRVIYYIDISNSKTIVSYRRDSNGNSTIVMTLRTDVRPGGEVDEFASRSLYEYDSLNRITKRTHQDLSQTTSSWITDGIYEFKYSVKSIEEVFTDPISNFKSKNINIYHTPDKELLVLSRYYIWDENSTEWSLVRKFELELNENSNPVASFNYEWSDTDGTLVSDRKSEYVYDDIGNIIRSIGYSFSEIDQTWVPSRKSEYSYKKGLNRSKVIGSSNSPTILYGNLVLTSTKRFFWHGEWEPSSETQYFYQALSFDKKNMSLVYPNPASNSVSFDLTDQNEAQLFLYSAQGANVIDQKIQTSRSISVLELKKGIYYYKIVTENGVQTGKLIKD